MSKNKNNHLTIELELDSKGHTQQAQRDDDIQWWTKKLRAYETFLCNMQSITHWVVGRCVNVAKFNFWKNIMMRVT